MDHPTPLRAVIAGLVAGAIGTVALDAVGYWRYRRGGGEERLADWESSSGLERWEDAPAPAQVGKRLIEGLFQTQLPPERARLVNNATHWGFGMAQGAVYGLVAGSLPRPRVAYGVPFALYVWSSGYVVLPLAGLYKPIWEYDLKTLAGDLSGHLAYGTTTAAAWQLLAS